MLGLVKLLFIGDIVGEPGRRAVRQLVPILRQRHGLDVVVANGENAAGGSGITPAIARDLLEWGVDAITSGDHLWDQKEVVQLLESEPRFLRPLNYPEGTPGHGSHVLELASGLKVGVLNAQGRTFMAALENPFIEVPKAVERLREATPILFLDFHAEATSEKIAMGRLLDGLVSAVIGTHTHVQTADEQVFPGGTAYLTDSGFTGPQDSVLGRDIEPVLKRFATLQPQRFTVASGRVALMGAVVEIDAATGRALSITRVAEPLPNGQAGGGA